MILASATALMVGVTKLCNGNNGCNGSATAPISLFNEVYLPK